MSINRTNINIELPSASIPKLQRIREWNGMTRKELVARLIDWFTQQDQVIQSIVLGQIPPEIAPDVVELLLLRLKQAPQTTDISQHASEKMPSSHVTDPHESPEITITIPHRPKSIAKPTNQYYQLTNI